MHKTLSKNLPNEGENIKTIFGPRKVVRSTHLIVKIFNIGVKNKQVNCVL